MSSSVHIQPVIFLYYSFFFLVHALLSFDHFNQLLIDMAVEFQRTLVDNFVLVKKKIKKKKRLYALQHDG